MVQRISIGFLSGPVNLRVSDDELTRLQAALAGEGWHDVTAEDGDVKLKLQHVLWLKVDKEEQRVGFGLGA